MNAIEGIKKEMNECFGFDLTTDQVNEFLKEHPEAIHFDTLERELFADHIAKKVTGMSWPMNGSPEEYKKEFYSKMKEDMERSGYKWNA